MAFSEHLTVESYTVFICQQSDLLLFGAGCPSCRPTNSVKALKARASNHWRHNYFKVTRVVWSVVHYQYEILFCQAVIWNLFLKQFNHVLENVICIPASSVLHRCTKVSFVMQAILTCSKTIKCLRFKRNSYLSWSYRTNFKQCACKRFVKYFCLRIL